MHSPLGRDVVPFKTVANGSVLINGALYNKTVLDLYNFATYGNSTLSNSSWCYLTLPNVGSMPVIFANGSIVNGTSCYIPYYGIGQRGSVGIAFAVLFGISIMFSLVCLKKHGHMFLPQEKRFRAIGRRWQWYWALFVAACGLISSISAVDVDRFYLPSSPIIIQTIFWYLMLPGVLACVWESVRHWGSWQERQLYDEDAFALRQNDRRSKVEFYLPLIFYLFAWLNFFLNIPRNWLGFQAQADPSQISSIAIPTATDPRFRVGAILAFIAWLIIPFSLWHSIKHYKPNARTRFLGRIRAIPPVFLATIPLTLVLIGYAEAQGWLWMINVGSDAVNEGYLYGFGYGPPVLILYFNIMASLHYPNEDLELIRQRLIRGQAIDAELGINRRARKPWWWTKVANEIGMDNDAKLRALARGVPGRQPADNWSGRNHELRTLAQRHLDEERGTSPTRGTEYGIANATLSPFRDEFDGVRTPVDEQSGHSGDASARGPLRRENSAVSFGSQTTLASTNQARPQQVRSMLDV